MTSPDPSATSYTTSEQDASDQTNFEALASFLIAPFLDHPEALKFHIENLAGGKKIWLRAAFDETEDKGRVFGRGGRNINAIRHVIAAAAKLSEMTVNLSVFGEPVAERSERGEQSGDRTDSRFGGSRFGGRGGARGRGSDRGGDRSGDRSGDRGGDRGGDQRPPRPSTNPAPPKKKPKLDE